MAFTFPRPKTLILALIFIISLILPFIIKINPIFASSVYDEALFVAPPIVGWDYAKYPGNSNLNCSGEFLRDTHDWYTLILENTFIDSSYKTALSDVVFTEGLGGWAVVASTPAHSADTTGDYQIRVITWNGTAEVSWTTPTATFPYGTILLPNTSISNRRVVTINFNCASTGSTPPIESISGALWSSTLQLSAVNPVSTASNTELVLISGEYNPNYPSGYAGMELQSILQYQGNQNPPFNLEVDGYNVKANYLGHELDDLECTYLSWSLINVDTSDEIKSEITDINTPFEAVTTEAGNYQLYLSWNWDHDQCGENIEESSFRETSLVFTIDGVSQYLLSNTGENCTVQEGLPGTVPVQVCNSSQQDYQDCSEFSWITDFGEAFNCLIHNTWISFLNLWKPKSSFISNKISEIKVHADEHMSFLTYGFTWFGDLVSSVDSEAEDCNVSTGVMFGASTSWNLCRLEDDWPAIWDLATVITRMAVVLTMFHFAYVAYNRIWIDR